MYDKVNTMLRSKVAVWGVTLAAILLFCITATFAFGAGKKDDVKQPSTAAKLPLVPERIDGLQVQSEPPQTHVSAGQLQGQEGNASVSQPAAPASTVPSADLDGGTAAANVQATGTGTSSANVSATLQPSPSNTGIQAQVNASGLNLGLQTKLP